MSSNRIKELIVKLSTEQDTEIINELISIGKNAIDQLIDALQHEKWYVRRKISEILGELQDKRVVSSLIEILKEEKNSYVRETCVESLGKIAIKQKLNEKSIDLLYTSLKEEYLDLKLKSIEIFTNHKQYQLLDKAYLFINLLFVSILSFKHD